MHTCSVVQMVTRITIWFVADDSAVIFEEISFFFNCNMVPKSLNRVRHSGIRRPRTYAFEVGNKLELCDELRGHDPTACHMVGTSAHRSKGKNTQAQGATHACTVHVNLL